ncbi:MAG: hypothetical protein WD768_00005, partial [Phycisphaeraceae bacterium]
MRYMFVVVLILTTIAAPRALQADDAQQVFDAVYGPRVKQVSGTTDRGDDVALAASLLAAARTSTDTPALLALMCEAAYDLGQRHADGYTTAADAMTLLAQTVPDQRDAARDKLAEILTKQSRAGKVEERDPALNRLLETLMAIGHEKMDARSYGDAAGAFRRVVTLAAPKKLPQGEDAKARMDDAMRLDRVTKQVARLQEKLQANANDFASAEEIVRLNVIELDDAAAALAVLDRVQDERMKQLTPLAVKALEELKAEEALALGEWLRGFAVAAKPQDRELWVRTEAYLSRFVEQNSEAGFNATKATVLLSEAAAKLKATPPAPPPPPP